MNRTRTHNLKLMLIAALLVVSLAVVAPGAVLADDPVWQGQYFNNPDLAGNPILVRSDSQVSFDWGTGGPASGFPADNFSVRWARNVDFSQDTYRFYANHDNGVRIFLDGNLIMNRWVDGANNDSVEVAVSGGTHNLRVEYYERGGNAFVHVLWTSTSPQVGNLISCVFPPPMSSWLKVYQKLPDGSWRDVKPAGYGAMSPDGRLKIDGLAIDSYFGSGGNPYRVELFAVGSMVAAVGNMAGEPPFLLLPNTDNHTPWQCGNMPNP